MTTPAALSVLDVDLSGATFDDASLVACKFDKTSLQGASFLGTDLTYAHLSDVQAEGARYDCRTRFQSRFDPVAAGMINVEGICPRP